jgi:hypothetical protein
VALRPLPLARRASALPGHPGGGRRAGAGGGRLLVAPAAAGTRSSAIQSRRSKATRGKVGAGGRRPGLPGPALRHPGQFADGLGRAHDLERPGALRAQRGHGPSGRADPAGVVRRPPLVPAADAGGPGGRPGGDPGGGGPSRLPAPVRRLLPRLAAADLRRGCSSGGPRRGGVDDPVRRPALFSRLRRGGRRGVGVQRPAAGLFLRRRPAAAPQSPAAAVRGAGGGDPAGRRRAHQGRGRDPGACGADAGGPLPPRAGAGPDTAAPALASAVVAARPGGPAGRAGPGPAVLLAGPHPRELRELRASHISLPALAGDRDAHPPARSGCPRRDGAIPQLGPLLVGGAPGADRRLARAAPAARAPPAPRRRGAPGGGLGLCHDQPQAGLHGQGDLGPIPAPGLGAAPGALRLESARSAAPRGLAAAGVGGGRQEARAGKAPQGWEIRG